jgi:hypothetical protein
MEAKMLRDFDHGGKLVTKLPPKLQNNFNRWKTNLNAVNPAFIPAIKEHINQLLDEGPIHTTGWMPGRERRRLGYAADSGDWTDTVFDPIFWHGTRQDYVAAAMCFGLFVCDVC